MAIMNVFEALIMGLVQGLTEFLPRFQARAILYFRPDFKPANRRWERVLRLAARCNLYIGMLCVL